MTMTVKEAYKVGFAKKLAELGVSPTDLEYAWFAKEGMGRAAERGGDALLNLGGLGLGALLTLPWFAGAFGGYALGGGKETSKADIDYLRQKSLVDEYAYAIDRLKRQREQEKLETEGAMQLPKAAFHNVPTGTTATRVVKGVQQTSGKTKPKEPKVTYPGYGKEVRKRHGAPLKTWKSHQPKVAAQVPPSGSVGSVTMPPTRNEPITVPGRPEQNIQNVQQVLMQPRKTQAAAPALKTMPNVGQSLKQKGLKV